MSGIRGNQKNRHIHYFGTRAGFHRAASRIQQCSLGDCFPLFGAANRSEHRNLAAFCFLLGFGVVFPKRPLGDGKIGFRPKQYPEDFRTVLNLLIASLPIVAAGLLLKDTIERSFNDVKAVCLFLLLTSFVLVLTAFLINRNRKDSPAFGDSLIIGIFQSLAIFPGISRSAVTFLEQGK